MDALLAERPAAGGSCWTQLVLHGPWPFVSELMTKHPRLREAALHHDTLIAAMSSPLTSAVACRLLEAGASIDTQLEASLSDPLDVEVQSRFQPRLGTAVVLVRGLPSDHAMAGVSGLYTSVPEEVGRRGVRFITEKEEKELGGRRRVYRQVGGHHCIWFRILEEEEEEEEEAVGISEGAKAGPQEMEEEDEDEDEDEEEEEEGEGGDDQEEEEEEPEEQEGSWLITRSELVGQKKLEAKQIPAMVPVSRPYVPRCFPTPASRPCFVRSCACTIACRTHRSPRTLSCPRCGTCWCARGSRNAPIFPRLVCNPPASLASLAWPSTPRSVLARSGPRSSPTRRAYRSWTSSSAARLSL